MHWEHILKVKVNLVMPLARECIIDWSTNAEVGTQVTLPQLHEAVSDCYLEKLQAWANENFEEGREAKFKYRLYSNFWLGKGTRHYNHQSGTLANLLMHNIDIKSNNWVRRSTKFAQGYLPSQSTTTIYVKVEAL